MSRWIQLFVVFAVCSAFAVAVPGCKPAKDADKDKDQKQQAKDDKKDGKKDDTDKQDKKDGKKDDKDKQDKKGEPEHSHIGPHGGNCAEWGEDDFHAEFIVDAANKKVIFYVLDGAAKAAPKNTDVSKIKDLQVSVKGGKGKPIELKHDPKMSSDKDGIAYTATDDVFAKPDGLKVNISGVVNDKPYAGDVEYKAPKKKTSRLDPAPRHDRLTQLTAGNEFIQPVVESLALAGD